MSKRQKPSIVRTTLMTAYLNLVAGNINSRSFIRNFLAEHRCKQVEDLSTAKLGLLVKRLEASKAEREAKAHAPKADPELFPGTKLSLTPVDATKEQVGGNHYKQFELQPAEICHRNKLTFLEGSVVKRMHRHSRGGKGIQDLKKAIHEIRLIAKFDYNEDI